MPSIDQMIREQIHGMPAPPGDSDAFREVLAKRSRYRMARRVGRIALALAVVGGSVAGTLALASVFGSRDQEQRPGSGATSSEGPGPIVLDVEPLPGRG